MDAKEFLPVFQDGSERLVNFGEEPECPAGPGPHGPVQDSVDREADEAHGVLVVYLVELRALSEDEIEDVDEGGEIADFGVSNRVLAMMIGWWDFLEHEVCQLAQEEFTVDVVRECLDIWVHGQVLSSSLTDFLADPGKDDLFVPREPMN